MDYDINAHTHEAQDLAFLLAKLPGWEFVEEFAD